MNIVINEGKMGKVVSVMVNYFEDTFKINKDYVDEYVDIVSDGGNSDMRGETFIFTNDDDKYLTYYDCDFVKRNFTNRETKCPYLSIEPRPFDEFDSLFGFMWKPIFIEWFNHKTGLVIEDVGK